MRRPLSARLLDPTVVVSLMAVTAISVAWFSADDAARDSLLSSFRRHTAPDEGRATTQAALPAAPPTVPVLGTERDLRLDETTRHSNSWVLMAGEFAKNEARAKAETEQAKADLACATAEAGQARAQASQAKRLLMEREATITGLEGEKKRLTKELAALNEQIQGLTTQIDEAKRKLSRSEGDRGLLQQQVAHLMAARDQLDLERQSVAAFRQSLIKLKEELSVAKRTGSPRRNPSGFEKKGAQLLAEGVRPAGRKPANSPALSALEIDADLLAKLIATTNSTAAK